MVVAENKLDKAYQFDRVEGYLFFTVLAHLVFHLVRIKLRRDGIHDNWDMARTELN